MFLPQYSLVRKNTNLTATQFFDKALMMISIFAKRGRPKKRWKVASAARWKFCPTLRTFFRKQRSLKKSSLKTKSPALLPFPKTLLRSDLLPFPNAARKRFWKETNSNIPAKLIRLSGGKRARNCLPTRRRTYSRSSKPTTSFACLYMLNRLSFVWFAVALSAMHFCRVISSDLRAIFIALTRALSVASRSSLG